MQNFLFKVNGGVNGGVYFICFRLKTATLFGKFVPKNCNCQFKLKIGTYTNSNMKNSLVMFIFCVFDRKYTFFGNFFQKSKFFVEAEV